MKSNAAPFLAILLLGVTSLPARGETVPAACLASESAQRTLNRAAFAATGYKATLVGTATHLQVGTVSVRDRNGTLTLPSLRDANTLVSLGLLSMVHGSTPAPCRAVETGPSMKALRDALHKGAVAELTWSSIGIDDGSARYKADRLVVTLRAGPTPGTVSIAADTSGLTAPGGSALPGRVSTRLIVPERSLSTHTPGPGEITISRLDAFWTKGSLSGKGAVTPGHDIATTRGTLNVTITDLSDLLATIKPYVPAGTTTALSVAQFMGHRDGNRVAWDFALENGQLKVNSFPIPLSIN